MWGAGHEGDWPTFLDRLLTWVASFAFPPGEGLGFRIPEGKNEHYASIFAVYEAWKGEWGFRR